MKVQRDTSIQESSWLAYKIRTPAPFAVPRAETWRHSSSKMQNSPAQQITGL